MTPELPTDDDITTPDEFDLALRRLILVAITNGIDPWGAWKYHTDGTGVDVDVEVVVSRVERSDESTDT